MIFANWHEKFACTGTNITKKQEQIEQICTCTDLHCVRGVFVVKDKCLLDQLVVSLQCVDFRGV